MDKVLRKDYVAAHLWIRDKFGSADHCEELKCSGESKRYQWALKAGESHGKNRSKYMQLCHVCHTKYDTDNRNRGHLLEKDLRRSILLKPDAYEALKSLAAQNHRSIVGQIAFFVSEERQRTPTTTSSERSQT